MSWNPNTGYKPLTPAQLENQLATWKRENRTIYNQYLEKAKEQGLITKRGKVSRAKRKSKALKEFSKDFKSYSVTVKEQREKYKEYKKTLSRNEQKELSKTGGFKKYMTENVEYSNLVRELFETIRPSSQARNTFDLTEDMTREEAISYLKKLLYGTTGNQAEEYKKQNGDYKPPFE